MDADMDTKPQRRPGLSGLPLELPTSCFICVVPFVALVLFPVLF